MQNVFSIFKGWIQALRRLIKEEPVMTALLVVVILVYSGISLTHDKKTEEPSKARKEIQLIEKKLKDQDEVALLKKVISEAGPVQLFFMVFVPLLLMLGLIVGVFLDSYLFTRLSLKKEIITPLARAPAEIPWGMREIVKSVIFALFVAVVLSLFLGAVHGAFFEKKFRNVFILIHTTLLDVAVVGFIFFTVVRRFASKLSLLGFRLIQWGRDIWLGFVSYAAALPILAVVLLALVIISELLSYEPPPHPLVEVFVAEDYENPALIFYSIFLACTVGPVIEEIFFRGFCYPAFKKKWGMGWAMVLSSAFFALIHQSLFAFLPIFVLGLVLSYVYEKRGSLLPSIVMHVTHNSIFIGYFFVLKRSVFDQLGLFVIPAEAGIHFLKNISS